MKWIDYAVYTLGILAVFIIGMTVGENNCKPTAMEVHQGKTTIKYTVRNGEILDSTIVYK
jgi:hypothetical protein